MILIKIKFKIFNIKIPFILGDFIIWGKYLR